jgi:hypothetical protein
MGYKCLYVEQAESFLSCIKLLYNSIMKKILSLLILIAAIAFISGRIQSSQYASVNDLKDTREIVKPAEASDPPKILFILNKDQGMARWSPSLWWSYQHKTQEGC